MMFAALSVLVIIKHYYDADLLLGLVASLSLAFATIELGKQAGSPESSEGRAELGSGKTVF